MISLEMARKLKGAGLRWKPQKWDLFKVWFSEDYGYIPDIEIYTKNWKTRKQDIWLPRLGQLLAEIEVRGFRWDMFIGNGDKYVAWLIRGDDVGYVVAYEVTADTPEDAAAKALLWILKQGR